jgi:hypothetical protein
MANFERIKDVVLTYTDEYAREFANEAPVRTGRLKNSYRGVAQLQENKFTIEIYGEYYGPFQSYGVGPAVSPLTVPEGINPPPLNGSTYMFKNPNRYIKANPFMQRASDRVTPRFEKALTEAGVKDVEEFFNDLSKIKVS